MSAFDPHPGMFLVGRERDSPTWECSPFVRRKILALLLVAPLLSCANSYLGAPAASGKGYALLYEILGQERQVSKLLLIKEEGQALETVVDAITKTCGAAYDRLEVLPAEVPRLDLSDTGLPGAEIRTRQAIAATRRDQLLAASGREFQLQLLLS